MPPYFAKLGLILIFQRGQIDVLEDGHQLVLESGVRRPALVVHIAILFAIPNDAVPSQGGVHSGMVAVLPGSSGNKKGVAAM